MARNSADFSANLQANYYYEISSEIMGYVRGAISYTGDRLASMKMDAYVLEDTTELVYGRGSGLKIEHEAASFDGVGYTDASGQGFAGGRYVQESYVIAGFVVGITNDEWKAELYIDNITDEHATLYIDNQQFTPKVVTNRPRTIGFRFSHDIF